MNKKKTIDFLKKKKKDKEKTVLITAYDYPQSIIAERAGVDAILVGDSIGMTTFGYDSTLPVTMDDMILHSKSVAKGAKNTFLIGDMPYMSYQVSDSQAINNAGKFIQNGMDCIKLEGTMFSRIRAISDSGTLVMGHLGLTPQTKAKLSGYKVQGKTLKSTEVILEQALRVEDAGCSFLLLEAMPTESAGLIRSRLDIPVYGIGAGKDVDGQLVIFHDLVGLFWDFKTKFVKRYCEGGDILESAIKEYSDDVRKKVFPNDSNLYSLEEHESSKIKNFKSKD